MRALAIWCLFGAVVLGTKMQLDWTAASRPDVAVRAGAATYFIPSKFIRVESWRADLLRLAGCWDARDDGMVMASMIGGCESDRPMRIHLQPADIGGSAAANLPDRRYKFLFWPRYHAPQNFVEELKAAWAGRNEFAGRHLVDMPEWKLMRVESAGSPWSYLLTAAPQRGDDAEFAQLYAGRCFRPQSWMLAGFACDFALRLDGGAGVEFALGPEESAAYLSVRNSVLDRFAAWRNEQPIMQR